MKKLKDIAFARSGDKGSHANIGVIAFTPEGYQFLEKSLTDEVVHKYFQSLGVTKTVRYELPNLLGLNFVLDNILQGGGSKSLRTDNQGKSLGVALLEMPIEYPDSIKAKHYD